MRWLGPPVLAICIIAWDLLCNRLSRSRAFTGRLTFSTCGLSCITFYMWLITTTFSLCGALPTGRERWYSVEQKVGWRGLKVFSQPPASCVVLHAAQLMHSETHATGSQVQSLGDLTGSGRPFPEDFKHALALVFYRGVLPLAVRCFALLSENVHEGSGRTISFHQWCFVDELT